MLDSIELGEELAHVSACGNRYALRTEGERDRLTVTSPSGSVVLRIEIGPSGPILQFDAAEIEVCAAKRLGLSAPEIAITAAERLVVESNGSMTSRVRGERRAHVGGPDRLEAASIERQASDGSVAVRAAGRIDLDGTHVGLNDNPCPEALPWTEEGSEPCP